MLVFPSIYKPAQDPCPSQGGELVPTAPHRSVFSLIVTCGKPEIHFRNFNKQRYNMGQYKGGCIALRRSRKKQNIYSQFFEKSADLFAHAIEVSGIRCIILVSIVRTFIINVVSCVMETMLNYHACVLHEGTFQQISQDTGIYRWLVEKAETFGARYPPAGAASQTAKLDATHNTGSAISLWYYFGHVMELTRSTGTKRCILSRQIPPWYQQQRENKYLIERTMHKPNGPKPKLIDPPIQENGINIIHMQMLKKRAIVMRNLYKKFNLPMKQQCMT
ncbi:hypothetical protein ALC53_08216 [Atta colombica]|uniref:Uncharacterized protein n=1 Tax=Atta colombica TaxID=520822 RepID=A0A151I2J9_9HYME|nr:hypothetical protein ALC53_08216 [Atta colombica]